MRMHYTFNSITEEDKERTQISRDGPHRKSYDHTAQRHTNELGVHKKTPEYDGAKKTNVMGFKVPADIL